MIQDRNSTNQVGGPIHHTVLDAIVKGIFGTSPDEMTQAEGAKSEVEHQAKAKQAYGLARNAAMDPGGDFMDPPKDVGKPLNLLKVIGGIAKFFGGLFHES
jgi:hypothetical protein